MIEERDLTGYCGLFCGDCIRYQCRASDLADELLHEVDRLHLAEYANVKKIHMKAFEDLESFTALLKAISDIKCDMPCRLGGDGCGGNCGIIACVSTKGFEGCWECDDVEECEELTFLKPFHGDAPLKNIAKIRELGIENWAETREKCYPWL